MKKVDDRKIVDTLKRLLFIILKPHHQSSLKNIIPKEKVM